MPSIAVENFGPIRRADVELKPLTIFVGANDSGKSYLALAVYALFRAFRGGRLPGVRLRQSKDCADAAYQEFIDHCADSSDEYRQYFAGKLPFGELPTQALDWAQSESEGWSGVYQEALAYELSRCFGSTLGDLDRMVGANDRKPFSIDARDESNGMRWTVRHVEDGLATDAWMTDASRQSAAPRFPVSRPAHIAGDLSLIPQLMLSDYADLLFRQFLAPAHYMPATRSGILQAYKTIAGAIVGRASSDWIESSELERLPGVAADLIQALLTLGENAPTEDGIGEIVGFLEATVLMGKIDAKNGLGFPEIRYKSPLGEFHLRQVSATISEVAPLALYLKYLARRGDLFILEEPEAHLNAANQMLMARAVAMLVNAGVRVLVATHSDIFLQQLNGLMWASYSSEESKVRAKYLPSQILNPSEVAAYTFEPGSDGTVVERMDIDLDYGISTEAMDEIHSLLYHEAIYLEHERLG